jgi:serine/threonine-protein kinase
MPKVCPVCGTSYADTNIFCPADGTTLRAADTDGDLIGSVIADRYLVTDLLGEGGMGQVYRARHVRLPQQAAIKVLRSEMVRDPAAIARFNREAANACRIEHERVARVFDFGETSEGLVYLAMEFVPGDSLKTLLQKEGSLTIARTAIIVRQIADGLDAAHRLGIVHRDLKPDNILVTQDELDGTDRCKVVDFGIAKAMGGVDKESLTKTGFVVGTPEFMSPEQLLGTDIDQRSDVYALALVAYQCLTGDLPFDSNTPDRGMTARLVSTPRTLRKVRPDGDWSEALETVLSEALAMDASQRTATAGAFARAFELATGGRAAAAPVPIAAAPLATPPAPAPAATPIAERNVPAPASAGSGGNRLLVPAIGVVALIAAGAWFAFGRSSDESSAILPVDSTATNSTPAAPAPAEAQMASAPPSNPAANPPTQSPAAGGAPSEATPTVPGKGATSNAAVAPERETTPAGKGISPAGISARRTLDSITNTLDPTESDEGVARAAIPVLKSILALLPTGTDSTWAYIRMAEAHLVMSEVKPACAALRNARGTARTPNQAEAINRYTGMLGCAQ